MAELAGEAILCDLTSASGLAICAIPEVCTVELFVELENAIVIGGIANEVGMILVDVHVFAAGEGGGDTPRFTKTDGVVATVNGVDENVFGLSICTGEAEIDGALVEGLVACDVDGAVVSGFGGPVELCDSLFESLAAIFVAAVGCESE